MTRKSDEQIHQEVLRELRWDSRVDKTEVGVEVDQGVVTLTGTVASYAKKLAAQDAAHRVTGVLDVANDVRVKVPGSLGRTDTEIAQAVRHALAWNVLVPETRITSTVTDGWVTLEGSVDRLRERDDAERAGRRQCEPQRVAQAERHTRGHAGEFHQRRHHDVAKVVIRNAEPGQPRIGRGERR